MKPLSAEKADNPGFNGITAKGGCAVFRLSGAVDSVQQ